MFLYFFFFNDTATTEIYTLSLHDALPISQPSWGWPGVAFATLWCVIWDLGLLASVGVGAKTNWCGWSEDRSEEHTLNSSHSQISYAVFCLKKKKKEARACAITGCGHAESS